MQLTAPSRFNDPAADAARLLFVVAFAVLFVGAPLLATVSRQAIYSLLPIGAVLTLVAASLSTETSGTEVANRLRGVTALIGLCLVLWAALSIVWTPFPAEAGVRVLKGVVTAALVITAAVIIASRSVGSDALMLPGGLAAAACAVVLVSLIDSPGAAQIEPDGTTTLDRAAIALVLLVWPTLAVLTLRGWPAAAGALAAAIAIAVFAAGLPVGILALGAGGLAYGAARLRRGRTRFALGIFFAALILFCPLIPLVVRLAAGHLPETLIPLKLWGDIIAADGARIFTGHGLDTATRGIVYGYLPPRTPHSLLFEVWYELGIVGAALAALFTYRIFMALGRAPRAVAPYLLAGFTTGLTVTMLGLGTAQVWWLTLVGLDVLAFAVTAKGHYGTRPSIIVRPRIEAAEER
ncbi:MAG: hypothetical protein JOZ16_00540 [Methylobacteriaceae bacterium]|nr:hypothetical protein [Methylobacteriaceae bacterium]